MADKRVVSQTVPATTLLQPTALVCLVIKEWGILAIINDDVDLVAAIPN